MSLNRCIRQGDNPDITKEREKATFDTDELAAEIFGGMNALKRRREINKAVADDPDFANPIPAEFLPREKKIEETTRKTAAMIRKTSTIIDRSKYNEYSHLLNEVVGIDGFPASLHVGMFLPALHGQADDDLAAEMIPRAMRFEILGTYAQTELGHGTNLRELETTATYDKAKQEFIMNTPTRTAMKWWPGNLGKMANYAVVAARLIIEGKNYGTHNFLVQLRCEETHKPLPGITVGEIGPKFSYNTTDNGFLAFENVRIPRRQMLMKHAKVSPDGVYTRPMHDKLSYGAMVTVRTVMISGQGLFLAQACTVAIRYSAVRRQGRIENGGREVHIMDYQTQQYRLFPQLALAYATLFTGAEVRDLYQKTLDAISKGNVDLLPDLHALTSGLKSVVTHSVGLGIEQCRMACGGHGYSMASGLPGLYGVQMGGCTYEGENMVMLQQCARYLIKSAARATKGESLSPSVAYLGRKGAPKKSLIGCVSGSTETELLLDAVEHAARRLVFDAAEMYQKRIDGGESKEIAWNGVTVEMNRAARVHTRLYMCGVFAKRVSTTVSQSTRDALSRLLSLFLHYTCVDLASHLLEDGYCNGDQMKYLKKRLYEDLREIRSIAVSLVDSFDFTDRYLNSVLGRRDGNVYESLYEWAKKSELNYTDVLPAFTKHMKPMMEANRQQSKL